MDCKDSIIGCKIKYLDCKNVMKWTQDSKINAIKPYWDYGFSNESLVLTLG